MKKMIQLLFKFPIYCFAGLFVAVGIPVNYFFLGEAPNNPLEQAEEAVIKSLTGIDVDLNPQD